MNSPARFRADEFIQAAGGEWRNEVLPPGELSIYSDSREPGDGRIFFAFRGEKFDAHDFLSVAIGNGAAAVCIEKKKFSHLPLPESLPVLLVEDTLTAYQQMARYHRQRFPALKLAAVTGSVGKTSVKEMLRAICIAAAGSEEAVLATVGNTNNYFGVPQNLLRLTPQHRYAVLEMGTNHHGEIEPLSRTAEPQVALVNSIAPCHLEFLGSLAGVATEKGHIFDGLPADGVAVLPFEAPEAGILEQAAGPHRILRFGFAAAAEVRAEYLGGDLTGSKFNLNFGEGRSFAISWQLTGAHQALNAAAAAATALALGIVPETIAAGLAGTELPGMRMAKSEIAGVTCINDAYNANPESMAAAFRQLAELTVPQELILVLGDMLELGEFEEIGHRNTLELAQRLLPRARIITVGSRFKATAAEPVEAVDNAAAAGELLKQYWQHDNIVFLKGSRGMSLERALPQLS